MVDIHCHILPGVDDGSGNLNDSIEMARLAADSGIRAIVATPHCNVPEVFENPWDSQLQARFQKLTEAIAERNIPITLYPGQEIYLSSGFAERIKTGDFIPIHHSRYCLVELDPYEKTSVALRKLQQILAEGYVPIVAHPERYGFIQEQGDLVYRIKELGCLVQINKGSLKGRFGRRARQCALDMLRNQDADFIASDGHSQYSRTPYLEDVYEMICEGFSSDYANYLLKVNPRKVLRNETI